MENAAQSLGEQLGRRDSIWDPGGPDLALGSDQPLGEGWFGHEKGPRDLRRRKATEHAQGEGHSCIEGQCRVAAGENQA